MVRSKVNLEEKEDLKKYREIGVTKFQALTPKSLESLGDYKYFLEDAFIDNEIRNIALTGKYGAGKSSIWKSYEELSEIENMTIHISLMGFEDKKIKEIKKDGQKELTEYINTINKIEFQILNQILYQVDSEKIPKSKYKVKKAREHKISQKLNRTLCMIIFGILGIVFNANYSNFSKFDELISQFIDKEKESTEFLIDIAKIVLDTRKIGSILIIGSLIFLIYEYLFKEYKYLYIKKLGFKDGEIEFNQDKKNSLFDIDEDEIVYIIRESGKKVIVFEDLDRFENVEIFSKLRVINSLVNLKCEGEPIRFIYMLRDDMFVSKERTKFFDLIIPIVPIINSSNSEGKVLKLFEDESIDKKLLERISIYIDDMRLLYNIYNEYLVYSKSIDIESRNLDSDKLLGIIVYKNIFPGDYEKLLEDKGYVYTIFDIYKNNIEKLSKVDKAIERLNNEIEKLNLMVEKNKYQLMLQYIPKNRIYHEMRDNGYVEFFTKLEENKEDEYTYDVLGRSDTLIGKEILEVIEKEEGYKEKEKLLDNMTRYESIDNKKKELKVLNRDRRNVQGMTLKELLEKNYIDEIDLFEDLLDYKENSEVIKKYGSIINNHYFPLIKFLIIDGYLDESYYEYLSYYHEGGLSVNDNRFIRSIFDTKRLEYDYRLITPKDIFDRLKISDFTRVNVLNYDLLNYIINNSERKSFEDLIDTIYENKKIEFLDGYLNEIDDNDKVKLIDAHLLYKVDAIDYWISNNSKVHEENIFFILSYILTFEKDKLNIIEEHNNIVDIIEKSSSVLKYQEDQKYINIESIVEGYIDLNIKFKDLTDIKIGDKLLYKIFINNLYEINLNNIDELFDKYIVNKNNLEINQINNKRRFYERQFTIINRNNDLLPMKNYIGENLEKYLEVYIDNDGEDIEFSNDERDIKIILNSEIDSKLKNSYLDRNTIRLESLEGVQQEFLDKLIETDRLESNYKNIERYYKDEKEITDNLLKLIEGLSNVNEWNKKLVEKDNYDLEKVIFNHSNIDVEIKEKLLESYEIKLEKVNEELKVDDINLFIDKNIVEMNLQNISIIKNYHEEDSEIKLIDFIEKNIIEYILLLENSNENEKFELIHENIVYELLIRNIEDENKENLLELYNKKIKLSRLLGYVKNKNISYNIISIIIDKYLDDSDIEILIERYSLKLDKEIQKLIINKIVREYNNIELTTLLKNELVINDLIDKSDLENDSKVNLIISMIDNEFNFSLIYNCIKSIEELDKIIRVFNGNPQIINEKQLAYRVAEALFKYKMITIGEARTENDFIVKKNAQEMIRAKEWTI